MIKKGLDAHYNAEHDVWVIDVPFGASPAQMVRVQAFLVRTWSDKIRTEMPGDRRDYFAKGLAAARAGRLQQRMVHAGDLDFFKATQRETARVFSFPSTE
jgi:hypothetical protein